jgi:hypothetical protein
MAVAAAPSASGPAFGVPRPLFRIALPHSIAAVRRSYAVSRDGQRFLVVDWPGDVVASPIVVVLGPPARAAVKGADVQ